MEPIDLEHIIQKSYDSLSAAELESIQDICPSEEEFNQLKLVFQSIEEYNDERIKDAEPHADVKTKLDDLFYQTHQRKPLLWYNSVWMTLYPLEKRFDQRPLVRIAAVLTIALSIVPLFDQPIDTKPAALATVVKANKALEASDTIIEVNTVESTPVEIGKSMKSTTLASTNQLAAVTMESPQVDIDVVEDFSKQEADAVSVPMSVSTGSVKSEVTFDLNTSLAPTQASYKMVEEVTTSFDEPNGFNPLLLDVLTATY